MAGKHEPGSSGSFYLSLATAALRAGLVIAAVILGIFVLSKAFPTGGSQQPQGQPGPGTTTGIETTPPEETEAPEEEGSPEEPSLRGVPVQVQNATGVDLLAAQTADDLKKQLGVRIQGIGNAERNYDLTTLFFARGARSTAEAIRDEFFGGTAEIDRMPADSPAEVDVVIVLGEDFAQGQGG